MYDLNVYKTPLSSRQVREMFEEGRCSNYSQMFGESNVVSWREVLREKRHGNIDEIRLDCPRDESDSVWDFLYDDEFYDKVISEDLLKNLTIFRHLEKFEGQEIDDKLIKHLKKHHASKIIRDAWDILYDEKFYNKDITKSLVEGYTSRWSLLMEFKGHRIDDNLIEHLEKHHDIVS